MSKLLGPAVLVPLAILALLLAVPMFGGPYIIYLVTFALTFSIFALGYDLLFGHTGMVSFGHSVFYGMPAYAMGMLSQTVLDIKDPFVLIGAAILTGMLFGAANKLFIDS